MTNHDDLRTKAEQLAAERTKYASLQPDTLVPKSSALELAKSEYVAGYMTARTITAEELEAAAKDRRVVGYTWKECLPMMRAAFEAAGFTVEGGE